MKEFLKQNAAAIIAVFLLIFAITQIKQGNDTTSTIKADVVELVNKEFTIDLSSLKKLKKGASIIVQIPDSNNEYSIDSLKIIKL